MRFSDVATLPSCGLLEHCADLLWCEAGGAEGAEAEGVVALGEADAGGVAHEVAVEVGGCREVERALQEDLAGGGLEEVAAADDFGDGMAASSTTQASW